MTEKSYSQVLLRMPSELKAALEAESTVNSRSLTAECNVRLQASFGRKHSPAAMAAEAEARYRQGLNEAERALLDLYRAMRVEQQLALITVLKR